MTTWLIHRISGLLMIVLFATKFVSGLLMLPEEEPSWVLPLHRASVLNIALIFLFSLHVCFGLKTILFELGLFKEKFLTYAATALALILSVVGMVVYLQLA